MIQAARDAERFHLVGIEARQAQRHGSRANRRQQIVGIGRRHDQDQMRRRFFQGFQERVRGLLIRAVDLIDQKYAPVAFQRLERGSILQEAHLMDGELPQRAIRRERQEIGVRGEEQRVFVALVGGPLFAIGDQILIGFQAEIVGFDLVRVV